MSQSPRHSSVLSRRRFVATVGTFALGAALVPGLSMIGQIDQQRADAPIGPDLAGFTAIIGQRFGATGAGGDRSTNLTLTSVSEWNPHGSATQPHLVGGEYFTLQFSAPAGQPLTEDTYQLHHERLGSFPLFLVPGVAHNGQPSYAAVIGRLPVLTA
jgi:hypothetical protein